MAGKRGEILLWHSLASDCATTIEQGHVGGESDSLLPVRLRGLVVIVAVHPGRKHDCQHDAGAGRAPARDATPEPPGPGTPSAQA